MDNASIEQAVQLCKQLYNPTSPQEAAIAELRLNQLFPSYSAATSSSKLDSSAAIQQQQQQQQQNDLPSPQITVQRLEQLIRIVATEASTAQSGVDSPFQYALLFALDRLRTVILTSLTLFTPEEQLNTWQFMLQFCSSSPNMPHYAIQSTGRILADICKISWFEVKDIHNVTSMAEEMGRISSNHHLFVLQLLAPFINEVVLMLPPRYAPKQRKMATAFRENQLLKLVEFGCRSLKAAMSGTQIEQSLDSATSTQPTANIFTGASSIMASVRPLDVGRRMVSASLELLKACFGYDFLGLNPDESGDEGTALHFPKEWKGLVQTDDFITLFADGYISAGPPLSTEFAHVLGQIASIRRTFFDEDFRTKHYLKILTWLTKVFSEGVWLDDQSCYHEVVRVVARLRAHYTFSDIEDKPEYAAFLEAFGRLSVRSMSLWSWSPQTLLYHLKFWSIVCGTRSLPQSIAPIIKRTSEALFNRYVSEMLNTVPGYVDGSSGGKSSGDDAMDGDLEDGSDGEDYPLLGEEALLDQLHMIGQIARCAAALNGNAILNLLNETINLYHNAVVQGVSDPNPRIVEERLAWVIYIASAYLFNRAPYNVTEEEDAMDAKMIVKVFELQNLVGQRVAVFGTPGLEHLELASLQFFNQVRLTYLGDHVSRSSKMYKHLAEDAPGLNSVQSIYNTILTFIINSLFRWPPGSRLVSNTLSIFDGLTIGFGTLRQVAPLDQTKLLLQNHSDPQILFLNSSIKNKDRLRYYAALTRCLFNEEPSNEVFDSFVAPFDRELCLLAEMSDAEFAQQSVAIRLINIFRSLRGVLIYMLSKRGFVMFFEWFFTTYSPVIFRAMSAWAANPQVATSILKYVSEFMQNRSQRLAFDVASANGILMFREASKYIWIYGQYVQSPESMARLNANAAAVAQAANQAAHALPSSSSSSGVAAGGGSNRSSSSGTKSADGDIYVRYYKPMYVCMEILQRALNGRYVAFGVFPLYGDDTLDRSFSTALAMVSTIPTAELLAYPKVCRAAFNLLEAATTESMLSVLSIDTQTYTTILTACIEGIRLGGAHSAMAHIFNVNTSTSACTVLDHLATYMINRQHAIQRQQRHASSTSPASVTSPIIGSRISSSPASNSLLDCAKARPDLLRRALCTIIDYAFFEENFTEWHMGRTMFALLILFNNEQCGQLYMQRIIEAQLPSRRDLASKTIGLLFKDINVPALTSPNREKFQSNFSAFRRELDAQGLVLSPPLSSVADGIVAGISASDAPPMLQNSMSFVA